MKLIILVFCLLVQVGINAQNLMDLKKNVQQKIQQQAGSFSEDEAAAALAKPYHREQRWVQKLYTKQTDILKI